MPMPAERIRYISNTPNSKTVENMTHVNTIFCTQNDPRKHLLKLWYRVIGYSVKEIYKIRIISKYNYNKLPEEERSVMSLNFE
jgi:hypothetical protein